MYRERFVDKPHVSMYSLYRPSPPEELFKEIITYIKKEEIIKKREKEENDDEVKKTDELKNKDPVTIINKNINKNDDNAADDLQAHNHHQQSSPDPIAIPNKLSGMVVDVGCGSGQATSLLGKYFEKVVGCDSSSAQVEEAKRRHQQDNVTYLACPAEELPFAPDSVKLITVIQAVHWFDMPQFFREARRCLVKDGVIALISYTVPKIYHKDIGRGLPAGCEQNLPRGHIGKIEDVKGEGERGERGRKGDHIHDIQKEPITSHVNNNNNNNCSPNENEDNRLRDIIVHMFYSPNVEWPIKVRDLVDTKYATIDIPFDDLHYVDGLMCTLYVSIADVKGYLLSWSSYQQSSDEKKARFIDEFERKVKEIFGNDCNFDEIPVCIQFEYFVRMGRKR